MIAMIWVSCHSSAGICHSAEPLMMMIHSTQMTVKIKSMNGSIVFLLICHLLQTCRYHMINVHTSVRQTITNNHYKRKLYYMYVGEFINIFGCSSVYSVERQSSIPERIRHGLGYLTKRLNNAGWAWFNSAVTWLCDVTAVILRPFIELQHF